MFKRGHIVYFKKAQISSKVNAPGGAFKGMGAGIFLDHIPQGNGDIHPKFIRPLFGEMGFVSFDDVIEFLGKEVGDFVVKKFTDKYYGKEISVDVKQPELPMSDPGGTGGTGEVIVRDTSNIIGINGKPINA